MLKRIMAREKELIKYVPDLARTGGFVIVAVIDHSITYVTTGVKQRTGEISGSFAACFVVLDLVPDLLKNRVVNPDLKVRLPPVSPYFISRLRQDPHCSSGAAVAGATCS